MVLLAQEQKVKSSLTPLKGTINLKIKETGEVKEEVLGLGLKEREKEEILTMVSNVLTAIR